MDGVRSTIRRPRKGFIMSIRAGIIGFGYMGNFHLRRSRESGVIDVIAAYDVSREKLDAARAEGLNTYTSLDAFLCDERIQLVFVCTPNNFHAPLSIAALNAGKHVMSEKPVTMNLAELDAVLAAARANDRIFTVHQNRRWDEDFLTVKAVVESGDIGGITSIVSRQFGQRGVCFGWRADPVQGGGMLYDWGIHLIDQQLCLWRGHTVTSVYARLSSILTPAVDDNFDLQLTFDNHVVVHIQVGTFSLQSLPRWFVYGDRGTLMIDKINTYDGAAARIKRDVAGFDSVYGRADIGPSRTMAPLLPEYLETIELPRPERDPLAYHRNLAAAVEGREAPIVSFDDMRRAMKIVDTAFASSKLDRVIRTKI